MRSLAGPFRGEGEFVTGGGLYGYDLAAGRCWRRRHAVKLQRSRPTSGRSTIEAEGLLAFDRTAPGFDGS